MNLIIFSILKICNNIYVNFCLFFKNKLNMSYLFIIINFNKINKIIYILFCIKNIQYFFFLIKIMYYFYIWFHVFIYIFLKLLFVFLIFFPDYILVIFFLDFEDGVDSKLQNFQDTRQFHNCLRNHYSNILAMSLTCHM
jgi:hypothetical protein